MSYIHSITIDNNQYLIEPLLYSNATVFNNIYQVTIANYVPFEGSILLITIPSNNTANAELSINNETPVYLYYNESQIPAGLLRAGYTYILSYHNENNSSKWNILNHIEEQLPLNSSGGLEYNANGELGIKINGITNNMILDDTIANDKLQNYTITIGTETVALGGSITLADLGLSTAMHFIGHVASESQYTPSDGSNNIPTISGWTNQTPYAPTAGDIVIDAADSREYVYTITDTWELLGQDASTTLDSDNETATLSLDNTWISRIQQNSDRTISIERTTLDTSGTWTGDANSLTTPHEIYVNLETEQNDNSPVTFNGTSDIAIGVDGILPITHGGTGADNSKWHLNGIVYGAQQTIGGVSVPYYEAAQAALLESIVSIESGHHYTTLELGNDKDITDPTNPHSEGQLILYSAGTEAHILQGVTTATGYIHYLINNDGYLLQKPDLNNAIGNNTRPVYIAQDGTITALTYTPHKLYYSASSTSFEETNHYATDTKLGINLSSWPTIGQVPISQVLYVNGDSIFNGNIEPTLGLNNSIDKQLGSSTNPWAKLYIDGDLGDAYTPIYWNDGVPTTVTTIQRESFSISPTTNGTAETKNILINNTNVTDNSQIVEIVVDTGASYLNSAIGWTIDTTNSVKKIKLTATVTNTVSGYILFRK